MERGSSEGRMAGESFLPAVCCPMGGTKQRKQPFERGDQSMEGTLLLFGYDQLPVILAAEAAVRPFGGKLQVVGPRSCGLTLGQLAAGASGRSTGGPWRADGGAVRSGPACGRSDPGAAKSGDLVPQGGADGNQPQLDTVCAAGGAPSGAYRPEAEGVRECGF